MGRGRRSTATRATVLPPLVAVPIRPRVQIRLAVVNYGESRELASRVLHAVDTNPHPVETEDVRDRLASVRAAAHRISGLGDRVPWEWTTAPWLDALQAALNAVVAPLESYAAQPVAGEGEAPPEPALPWEQVAGLWAALGLFLPAIPGKVDEDLAAEVTAFRDSANAAMSTVSTQVEELEHALGDVDTKLKALEAARAEAIATLTARQAELEATITEQAARLEAAIRDNQAQFSASQETHRQEFAALVQDARETLTTSVTELEAQVNDQAERTRADLEHRVAALAELEQEARKSWDAVSTASVAGFFQTEANRQAKAANRWRLFGVAVLVVLAAVSLAELFLGDSTPSIEHTAGRLPFVFAAVGLAGYALRESHSHRRQALRLRQREVDVSTIAPYLANVGDAAAAERLKLAHAARLFLDDPEAVAARSAEDLAKDDQTATGPT